MRQPTEADNDIDLTRPVELVVVSFPTKLPPRASRLLRVLPIRKGMLQQSRSQCPLAGVIRRRAQKALRQEKIYDPFRGDRHRRCQRGWAVFRTEDIFGI